MQSRPICAVKCGLPSPYAHVPLPYPSPTPPLPLPYPSPTPPHEVNLAKIKLQPKEVKLYNHACVCSCVGVIMELIRNIAIEMVAFLYLQDSSIISRTDLPSFHRKNIFYIKMYLSLLIMFSDS